MPLKSSSLDFVPSSLLNTCSGAFSDIIANLANMTFQLGLYRQVLDAMDPSSYRPISNLKTISKVLERLVLNRITSQMNSSAMFDKLQLAYQRGNLTSPATCHEQRVRHFWRQSISPALDLSATFDCIYQAAKATHTTLAEIISRRSRVIRQIVIIFVWHCRRPQCVEVSVSQLTGYATESNEKNIFAVLCEWLTPLTTFINWN